MIILDAGSGNTCKNDINYVKRMIDELKAVDTGKHKIVVKWQLFQEAGDNIPLERGIFAEALVYAMLRGYKTTASVFDISSMKHLLKYNVPFVKIANRPDLYWLAGEVPRKIPVYASVGSKSEEVWTTDYEINFGIMTLACVSQYPATLAQYEEKFNGRSMGDIDSRILRWSISDHTTDFTLYHKYKPSIYECHYKLSDSTGLDAGDFARTPEQLAEIL